MGSNLHRNTFFSFLSAVFRLSANAVMFILVARFYGPEGFGQFTTAHTLATVFILFADFGFDVFLTTEIAQRPEKSSDIVPRMAAIKLCFASVASAAMAVSGFIQSLSPITTHLVFIFCFYLFFSALLNFMFAMFRGLERMQYESIITLIVNLSLVITLILLGVFGASLLVVATAFVASRVLGLFLALMKSRGILSSIFPIFDAAWLSTVWKQTSVFGVHLVFATLFFTQDTILLSVWRGDREVGIYQSVFRIMAISLIVVDIVFNALLPGLSRFYDVERSRWHELAFFVNKILYFIGLLIGFFFVAMPETIMLLAYGSNSFHEAVPVARIFGLVVVVRYMFEVPAIMLTTSHRQSVRMKLVVGATLVNFVLNVFAIPRFGVIGASIVSLTTNILVGVGYVLAARRDFSENWFSMERIIPPAVLAFCWLAIGAVRVSHVWMSILITTTCYLLAVGLFGVSPLERSRMFRIISKMVMQE